MFSGRTFNRLSHGQLALRLFEFANRGVEVRQNLPQSTGLSSSRMAVAIAVPDGPVESRQKVGVGCPK